MLTWGVEGRERSEVDWTTLKLDAMLSKFGHIFQKDIFIKYQTDNTNEYRVCAREPGERELHKGGNSRVHINTSEYDRD